jgi:hypothetical protein
MAKMVAGPLPDGLHRLNCMLLDGRLLVDGDLLEVDERMGVKGTLWNRATIEPWFLRFLDFNGG